MKTACVFVLCSAFVAAQDPAIAPPAAVGVVAPGATPSAAEQQFREAWWAESGRNDLDAALRGYLAAVIADGPPAVRAKAMLAAGRIQQKQGRTEPALASFRRVLSEFAGETEIVAAARTHLRELTAVDLRQGYDEWYERRLFSEEVQLVILGKLEAMSSHLSRQFADDRLRQESQVQRSQLRGEILAFGKGAVPALRKAAGGRHQELADMAIEMLFELGEMPPVEALVRNEDWVMDVRAWQQLLRKPVVVPTASAAGWHVPFLAATPRGPSALVDVLLQAPPQHAEAMSSLVAALLATEGARARLLAMLGDQEIALVLRDAIAQALQNEEMIGLSSAEWLLAARDPLRWQLQVHAVNQATLRLAADQPRQLDELLALVAAAPGDGVNDGTPADGLLAGLEGNVIAERLPWTPERLQAVFAIAGPCSQTLPAFTLALRRNDRTRTMLAAALLDDPSKVAAAWRREQTNEQPVARLRETFPDYEASLGGALAFRRLWHHALAEALTTRWPGYDERQRLDALALLDGMTNPTGDRRELQDFLRQQVGSASDGVKAAMAPLLEPPAKN